MGETALAAPKEQNLYKLSGKSTMIRPDSGEHARKGRHRRGPYLLKVNLSGTRTETKSVFFVSVFLLPIRHNTRARTGARQGNYSV